MLKLNTEKYDGHTPGPWHADAMLAARKNRGAE